MLGVVRHIRRARLTQQARVLIHPFHAFDGRVVLCNLAARRERQLCELAKEVEQRTWDACPVLISNILATLSAPPLMHFVPSCRSQLVSSPLLLLSSSRPSARLEASPVSRELYYLNHAPSTSAVCS